MPFAPTAAIVLSLLAPPGDRPDPPPVPSHGVSLDSVPSATRDFARGMVVSCPRAGQIWGTDEMADALAELRALGVEWVAIHPYAWVRRDGSVEFRPAAETEYLDRAAELVRAAGLELFVKPHLGYWGSFEWRGAIDFGDDELAWKRFFHDYRRFVLDQARFAAAVGSPLFAVGVELDRTVRHEERWRRLLAEVRIAYDGEITYAANWDAIERVPFWDAVDLIGVHAYFPLTDEPDPGREAIWRAWDGPLDELRALSRRHGTKRILVAELGYNRSPAAAREPWAYETVDTEESRELRRRLAEVAIERLEREPLVSGIFWWKWMPGPRRGRNFRMTDPEMLEALRRHWTSRDPSSTTVAP